MTGGELRGANQVHCHSPCVMIVEHCLHDENKKEEGLIKYAVIVPFVPMHGASRTSTMNSMHGYTGEHLGKM
jgi:hypothetical protein